MSPIGLMLATMFLMAKDDKKGSGGKSAPDDLPPEDGWQKVETERPYYNVEKCRSTPLQGYLLAQEEMPPNDNGAWEAFVVKLTAPCLASPIGAGEDADPVAFPAGTEVMIPATVKLKVALTRYLLPSSIVEVRIVPVEKVKLEGRRTMWTFDVRANERTVKTRPAIHALRPKAPRARQDDIPF